MPTLFVQLESRGAIGRTALVSRMKSLPQQLWGGVVAIFVKARDTFSQPYLWDESDEVKA